MALHLMLLGAWSAVTIRTPKPDLASGIHGGSLVRVVGTESVGVLGALLAGGLGGSPVLLFTALAAAMVGLVLYVIVIGLVLPLVVLPARRRGGDPALLDQHGRPGDHHPGVRQHPRGRGGGGPGTEALRGFLDGMTVLAWAGANWWVRIRGPTVRRRYHAAVTVTASLRMSFERRPGGLVATLLFIALVVAAMGSLGAPLITSVATTCRAALTAARRRRTDG